MAADLYVHAKRIFLYTLTPFLPRGRGNEQELLAIAKNSSNLNSAKKIKITFKGRSCQGDLRT
jgi:hypothetical protein